MWYRRNNRIRSFKPSLRFLVYRMSSVKCKSAGPALRGTCERDVTLIMAEQMAAN
jgi:hypothetical protein